MADSVPSLSPFGLTQHQLDHLDLGTQKYLEFVRPTFSWTLRSRQGDEVPCEQAQRADIFLDLGPVDQWSNVVKRIVFSLTGILPFAHEKILEVNTFSLNRST